MTPDWKDRYSIGLQLLGLGAPLAGLALSICAPVPFSGSPLAWFLLLVWALITDFGSQLLKRLIAGAFPSASILRRPKGAVRCNTFCSDGDQSGQPGFPSGHSSMAGLYAAIVLTLSALSFRACDRQKKKEEGIEQRDGKSRTCETWSAVLRVVFATVLALVVVGLTAYVRISKGCHNLFQVIGGTVWGAALGVGYAFAVYAI